MDERNLPAGLIAIAFSVFGCFYIAKQLIRALSSGFINGRWGDTYVAGSLQYNGFIAFCMIGFVLMLVLAYMGARWAGFIGDD